MTIRKSFFVLVPFLLLAACSSEAPKEEAKKEAAKPVEPVTGRTAFYKMYISARTWATDVEVLQLIPVNIPEVPSADGKFGAWRATFVSPSKRGARTYTFSVADSTGIYAGVFGGADEAYSGPRGQISPFNINALKVDSDAALKTAVGKSAEYIKKYPDKPVTFLLENNKRFQNPSWRVIWGDSISSSNYSIFVDASTGDYLVTAR